jgi:para-nitrobenzyl esterase
MKKPHFSLFLCFFIVFSQKITAQLDIVMTQNGQVSGSKKGAIQIFKGIPFAAPPVGNLRWKAPQPAANWSGVRACTAFLASPFQANPQPFSCWTEEFIAPPKPLSEDCLYLNVWTGAQSVSEKRPVFVWIYGGGFGSGSAACAIYDGEEYAKRGVVFVSINYRVAAFGFMAHPELTREQGKASGNYGILDQIAALQWVQKNIAAFGGDPQRVTIAGQSAGSMSVNALVASPLAKGLFHGAIAQSGGLLSGRLSTTLADAEKIGVALQGKSSAKTLAELRALPADSILKYGQSLGALRMGLTADDYVLPKNMLEHFKNGSHNDVPLLTGWVAGDGGLFGAPNATAATAQKQAKEQHGDKATAYLDAFPANTDEEAKNSQKLAALLGFAAFPSRQWALANKNSAYLYHIEHVPTDKPNFPNYGAFHTSEVPYALHNLHTWQRPWQQHDLDVENLLSAYWVNFIKTGNPNGTGLPEWKKFDNTEGGILEVTNTAVMKKGLFKKQFEVLTK